MAITENDIVVVSYHQSESWAMIPSPDRTQGYECFFPHFFAPTSSLDEMGLYMFMYIHCVEFSPRTSDPQWSKSAPYRINGIAKDCGISVAKCIRILSSLKMSTPVLTINEEIFRNFMLHCNIVRDSSPSHVPTPRKARKGYVYFLREDQTGTHKIGCTRSLNQRLSGIILPCETSLTHYIESDDYQGLERKFHIKYEPFRVNGEWFNLSAEHIEEIKQLGSNI